MLVFWFRHGGMARVSHELHFLGQPWSHMLTPFSAWESRSSTGGGVDCISSKEPDPSVQLGLH